MSQTAGRTILVVDDEQAITDLLEYNLLRNGYQVIVAHDGHEALNLALSQRPDLIILDLMLPGLDGLDVCRELQRDGNLPIIMLTARVDEVDRVVGLELGADDYITKPFSVRELLARVRAVLRRTCEQESMGRDEWRCGLVSVDVRAREAYLSGRPLPLTRLEFDLLATLIRHAGLVLSREQLLDQVWGYDYYGDSRAVDTTVKRLRATLREADGDPALISTVRGVGYRLDRS